jgi:hypothetical protein
MNHQRRRTEIGGADSSRIKEDPTPSFCALREHVSRSRAIAEREEVES